MTGFDVDDQLDPSTIVVEPSGIAANPMIFGLLEVFVVVQPLIMKINATKNACVHFRKPEFLSLFIETECETYCLTTNYVAALLIRNNCITKFPLYETRWFTRTST